MGNFKRRPEGKRSQQSGFNLLELIVAMLIIGVVSSFSIPAFQRSMVQGQVDRYMQNLESGLFQLRARMGIIEISCDINFAERRPLLGGSRSQVTTNTFYPPDQILEIQQSDETRANSTMFAKMLSTRDAVAENIIHIMSNAQNLFQKLIL